MPIRVNAITDTASSSGLIYCIIDYLILTTSPVRVDIPQLWYWLCRKKIQALFVRGDTLRSGVQRRLCDVSWERGDASYRRLTKRACVMSVRTPCRYTALVIHVGAREGTDFLFCIIVITTDGTYVRGSVLPGIEDERVKVES